MAPDPVHYVPLDCVVAQPPRVVSVCGSRGDGLHWSTATNLVTCDRCSTFIALRARLAHEAVAAPEAPLIDPAEGS